MLCYLPPSMKKLLVFITALAAAGCTLEEEVSIPSNDEDFPPTEYMASTLDAQEEAKKQIALLTVKEAVEGYRLFDKEKRYPSDLNELVKKGMLPSLPDLPTGVTFTYEAEAGEVGLEEEESTPETKESDETEG